jgi:hypothetical protein
MFSVSHKVRTGALLQQADERLRKMIQKMRQGLPRYALDSSRSEESESFGSLTIQGETCF